MKIYKSLLIIPFALTIACNGGEEKANEVVEEPTTDQTEMNDTESTTEADAEKEARLMVPEGANVFFVNLENGQTVSSPVSVEMGVEGMEVKPAGEIVNGTGHHHIIINKGHISKGDVVPADEQHIHYGDGSTSTELELEPGNYTLTMQFANGIHESYGEQMSATVEITVE